MSINVDFYLLTSDSISASRLFISRLAEKIYKKEHELYIYTATAEAAQQFNDSLWTFRDISFVPHKLADNTEITAPIVIGHNNPPADAKDVLMNLTPQVPDFYANFQRILEIIPADDALKAAGRKKYKFYQANDCKLEVHAILLDKVT